MAKPKLTKSNTSPIDEEVGADTKVEENATSEDVYTLLAGYTDNDGIQHKTFTLREMTGRDEEAISKGDIKENGSKVISVLLERCVLSIGSLTRKNCDWKEVIRGLYTGDQDYMLLKLREISLGGEIEVSHICPNCKNQLKTFLEVDELDMIPFKGQREIPFELPKGHKDKKGVVHRTGIMRLATGLDREILTPLAKKNLAIATTVMLTRICKFDDGSIITEDTMSDLTVRDREYLQNLLSENQFGVNLDVEVTCTQCGEDFKGSLNPTNFI